MEDIKPVVAKNISDLRNASGMTQIDLAERLNYSDKSVSKWERGESLPDVSVLMEIANLFDVSLDYLVSEEHPIRETEARDLAETNESDKRSHKNHGFITGMSVLLVWLVAALAFVICDIISTIRNAHFLAFTYAVPASMIVWLVFNSIWFNTRRNFIIISLLMWSTLASLCLSFTIIGSINIWLVMILGVFGQAIILLWSKLK